MAEERIWLEYDIPKPKGAVEATCCTTMTRQEAIERMAKAICSKWGISSCKSCAYKGDGSMCQDFIDEKKSLAEAALNALLEVEK